MRSKLLCAIIALPFLCGFFVITLSAKQAWADDNIHLTGAEKAWLDSQSEIVIGHDGFFPPYSFQSYNGEIKGMAVDVIGLVADRLDIRFSLYPSGVWQEIYQAAKNGEIDVIGAMNPRPDREEWFTFTRPYIRMTTALFTRDDCHLIREKKDLHGKRVALVKGYAVDEQIAATYADIQPVYVDNILDALASVSAGNADVLVSSIAEFSHYTVEQGIGNLRMAAVYSHESSVQAIGVRNDRPLLASILDKGLASISDEEMAQIRRRWISVGETPKKAGLSLSPEEQAWLKAHPVIRVASDAAWAPMEYADRTGTYKGIAIDYLRTIEKKLGIRFEIVRNQPWHALMDMAKNREIDMFSCVAKTPERSEFLSFSPSYSVSPVVIFSRMNSPYIGDLAGLEGKKAAVVRGYAVQETLARAHPGITLVPASSIHDALDLLNAGDVDAYVGNLLVTSYHISEHGYKLIKVAGKTPYELSLGLASRNDWPLFAGILKKALDSISQTERNTISRKWFSITYEHDFDYSLIWKIAAGACLIFAVLFFWNRRLKGLVENKTAALLLNEDRLKAIFNHRFQLTGLLDHHGKVLMANETACKMVGVSESELKGRDFWCLPHWSHSEALQQEVRAAFQRVKTGESIRFETTHSDANGGIRNVEFSFTPVLDAHGELVYIVPEGRDITERKLWETRLVESEKNYREIYNASSDAILIHDAGSGHIVDVNQTMLDMYGYSREEALDLEIGDISSNVPPFNQDGASAKIEKAVRQGPQLFEWMAKHKDGTCFWVEVALRRTEIGGKGRVLAVVRDITKRKQLDNERTAWETALRQSEKKFRAIFEKAPVGIAIIDSGTGRFLHVNQKYCDIVGYSEPEMMSFNFQKITHPDDLDEDLGNMQSLRSGRINEFKMEKRYISKSGDTVFVLLAVVPLRDSGFERESHVAIVEDITEQKKAEKETARLEFQLQQAQKMEAIGTLAGGIAHDFNNILSSIIGFSEILMEDIPQDGPQYGYVRQVVSAGQRAGKLVEQILTFSRRQDRKMSPLKIHLIVKETLKLLRSSIPTTIDIRQYIDPGCGLVVADPTQVQQVVMNLCTNAYHAMKKAGGVLSVNLRPRTWAAEDNLSGDLYLLPGPYLELEVTDTGHGIEQQYIDKVFEPYFTTKEKGEGTGLGLAIVHGIVNDFNGTLTVHSRIGKGTTFLIYLPVAEEASGPVDDDKAAESLPGGTERILLVDDEPGVVDFTKLMLESLGYRVSGFFDSRMALDAFRSAPHAFDLVITDMTMPHMTGEELIKRMVAERSDIPVILCTGYSDSVTPDRAKEIGFREYMGKPVLKRDLATAIRQIFDGAAPETHTDDD